MPLKSVYPLAGCLTGFPLSVFAMPPVHKKKKPAPGILHESRIPGERRTECEQSPIHTEWSALCALIVEGQKALDNELD